MPSASTMHAETVEDVLDILGAPPLNIPDRLMPGLNLVINLVLRPQGGPHHSALFSRCICLLPGAEPAWGAGGAAHRVGNRRATYASPPVCRSRPTLAAVAAEWAGSDPADLCNAEHAARTAYLQELQAADERAIPTVRRRLAAFSDPAQQSNPAQTNRNLTGDESCS